MITNSASTDGAPLTRGLAADAGTSMHTRDTAHIIFIDHGANIRMSTSRSRSRRNKTRRTEQQRAGLQRYMPQLLLGQASASERVDWKSSNLCIVP